MRAIIRSSRPASAWRGMLAAAGTFIANTALADPGLSGLEALYWLFLIAIAVFAVGLFIILPGVIMALRQKRTGDPVTRRHKLFVGMSVLYLVLMLPGLFAMLSMPRVGVWQLAGVTLFLSMLSVTLLYFFDNRKIVFGAIGATVLIALAMMPGIVSFTHYEVIDNEVLENPVALLPQKDSEYLPLADGRLFHLQERFNSSGPGDMFPSGTQFSLTVTQESGIFYLNGLTMSQALYEHQIDTPDAFISIPLRTVSLTGNQSYVLGKARLLEGDWKADDAALKRAVNSFCCDPDWVAELIERGADAQQAYLGYGWTLMHTLARRGVYGDNVNRTARLLVENGTDLNAIDKDGQSALHDALLAMSRDAWHEDKLGAAPREFLALLLELGANPDSTGRNGDTPLHHSIHTRLYSIASLLLQNGADPLRRDRHGKSALDLAIEHRDLRNHNLSDEQRAAAGVLAGEMQSTLRAAAGGTGN